MKVSVCCTWPGCYRYVVLPKAQWYCRLHLRMKRLLDANAAKKVAA